MIEVVRNLEIGLRRTTLMNSPMSEINSRTTFRTTVHDGIIVYVRSFLKSTRVSGCFVPPAIMFQSAVELLFKAVNDNRLSQNDNKLLPKILSFDLASFSKIQNIVLLTFKSEIEFAHQFLQRFSPVR